MARSIRANPVASQLAHRASWNFVDQLLSSLSNFLLSVLVARSLSADGYGAFALSFSLYGFAVILSRFFVSQPLTIRFSGAAKHDFDVAASQSVGAALVSASLFGAVIGVAGLATGGELGASLLSTGILLPGLLVQDAYRTIFFTAGRPAAAALNDGAWGLAMVFGVVCLDLLQVGSPVAYLWTWGLSACVAALLGGIQTHVWPAPLKAWRWVVAHSEITRYSVTEVVVIVGSSQLTLVVAAAVGGLSVLGALRGAQVLTAPTVILTTSALAFVVPELARRPDMTGVALRKAAIQISGVCAALMAVWCAALLLIPNSIGQLILGETWVATHAILLPTVIGVLVGIASLGASAVIYARAAMRVMFTWVLLAGPVCLLAGIVGVVLGGAYGVAIGLSIAAAYQCIVAWSRFTIVSRRSGGRVVRETGMPPFP